MEDWKNKLGDLVFSTGNPNESDPIDEEFESSPTPPESMTLRIWLDRKSRKGKAVTLIKGFNGTIEEQKDIARQLKNLCAVGGSIKDDEILIQGDHRKKVLDFLIKKGFSKTKLSGG